MNQPGNPEQLNRGICFLTRILSFLVVLGLLAIIGSVLLASLVNPLAYLLLLVIIPILAAGFFVSSKMKRYRLLVRLDEEWGRSMPDKRRDFTAIRLLFDELEYRKPGSNSVDDQTWHDLNMDQVYQEIDRTMTDPGEAALYRILRTPLLDYETIRARQQTINVFQNNRKLRDSVRFHIGTLGHQYLDNDLFLLLWEDLLPDNRKNIFLTLMPIAATLSILAPFIWNSVILALIPVGIFAANLMIHYLSRRRYRDQLLSFPYLIGLIKTAKNLTAIEDPEFSPYLSKLSALFKDTRKILSKTRFLLPVSDSPSSTPAEIIFEYLNIFFLLEVRSFKATVSEIAKRKDALKELYLIIGELDAIQSVASYRTGLSGFTEPVFSDDGLQLDITGARYPLLQHPVTASLKIEKNGIILTGSNMSGKSTFLRNIGCNVLLAQTIATCLAESYTGSFFRVITSISQTDDVIAGKSYYFVEAERLLRTIQSLDTGVPTLCIIDELLSGTNSRERLKASDAILNYLIRQNSLVICATHDLELIEKLRESYDLYHFTGTANQTGLHFDYQLRRGPADTQNAIELLEYLGYPKEITERARNNDS